MRKKNSKGDELVRAKFPTLSAFIIMVNDISKAQDTSWCSEGPVASLKESKADENLWTSLLSEVQSRSHLPDSKNLLVLGDKESGKTTLIAKLQGNEDPKKGAGLEYGYIDVRDEYRDGEIFSVFFFLLSKL